LIVAGEVPGKRIAPGLSRASPSIISSTAFSGRFKNFFIAVPPVFSLNLSSTSSHALYQFGSGRFASITARFMNCGLDSALAARRP